MRMVMDFVRYFFWYPGIAVFAVGITDLIDEDFLAAISGDIMVPTGQQRLGYDYFTAPSFQSLNTMFDIVSAGICREPVARE